MTFTLPDTFQKELVKGGNLHSRYQVFCDNLSGMTCFPALAGGTLQECCNNIINGLDGCKKPSQDYMYYIYKVHQQQIPYWGKRADVYCFVKAVAGSSVEYIRHKEGLQYAITNWEDEWLFTDKMFAER